MLQRCITYLSYPPAQKWRREQIEQAKQEVGKQVAEAYGIPPEILGLDDDAGEA